MHNDIPQPERELTAPAPCVLPIERFPMVLFMVSCVSQTSAWAADVL